MHASGMWKMWSNRTGRRTPPPKAKIEHLNLLIAKLHRMRFGRSSEKLDRQIEQLEWRLEEFEADEGPAPIDFHQLGYYLTGIKESQAVRTRVAPRYLEVLSGRLPDSAGKVLATRSVRRTPEGCADLARTFRPFPMEIGRRRCHRRVAQVVTHDNQFHAGVQCMGGVRMTQPVGAGVPQLLGERRMARVDAFRDLPKKLTQHLPQPR